MRTTRYLRSLWQQAQERLSQDGQKALLQGAARFLLEKFLLVFGMAAVAVFDALVPASGTLPASAQAMYDATTVLGTLTLVCWMGQRVFGVLEWEESLSDTIKGCIVRFILLAQAMIAIRAFGADLAGVVEKVKSNPDQTLGVVAALILVRVAFGVAPERRGVPVSYRGAAAVRRQRSSQDVHRTAVHEAGHLCLYGGKAELPPGLVVKVFAEMGDQDVYRGFVGHSVHPPGMLTEGYLRWSMLLHLAGSEAERVVLGERADGSASDNSKWLDAATTYLSSGFGEVFYADPFDDDKLAHNRAVLNDLKAECTEDVRAILMENRALLDELTDVILEKKVMDRDEIAPYLVRVVGVDSRWHEGDATPIPQRCSV